MASPSGKKQTFLDRIQTPRSGESMEITIIHKQDNVIHFLAEGIDVAFANALRRTMLTRLPAMAVDEVLVIENTSVMYDEMLAHRLGLVPLVTDLESYNLPEDCDCDGRGCSLCQVTLTLEQEAGEEDVVIYSGDMVSQDPKVVPASAEIPLVKLAPHQRLIIEAYARLGKGVENAKFQPVSTVSYKYVPIVEVNKEKCTNCGDCVEVCPKNILLVEDDTIATQNTLDCSLCEACVEVCEPGAISIDSKSESFLFKVESTGSLSPEIIVEKSTELLKDRIQQALDYANAL
ncbi:DNA-directed RNA polymerase subunit D [Candidatus Thorarchaeota archaeon]|nr:MAG: DNA-directed RNA polymerase subunit D [Candidatus Thorarchaeota archaeon]